MDTDTHKQRNECSFSLASDLHHRCTSFICLRLRLQELNLLPSSFGWQTSRHPLWNGSWLVHDLWWKIRRAFTPLMCFLFANNWHRKKQHIFQSRWAEYQNFSHNISNNGWRAHLCLSARSDVCLTNILKCVRNRSWYSSNAFMSRSVTKGCI